MAEITELITVYVSLLLEGTFLTCTHFRLQPLLLSRFLINLRQINPAASEERSAYVSNVGFARRSVIEIVVGNMGEALDDGLHDPLLQDVADRDVVNDDTANEEVICDIIHIKDMKTEGA